MLACLRLPKLKTELWYTLAVDDFPKGNLATTLGRGC